MFDRKRECRPKRKGKINFKKASEEAGGVVIKGVMGNGSLQGRGGNR